MGAVSFDWATSYLSQRAHTAGDIEKSVRIVVDKRDIEDVDRVG